jgi:hypothetical protein
MNQAIYWAVGAGDVGADATDPDNWVTISCGEYETLVKNETLKVWSSLTDPHGHYGDRQTMTVWGDDFQPTLATVLEYNDDGSKGECHHAKLSDWLAKESGEKL